MVGVYTTQQEAYEAGLKELGNVGFLATYYSYSPPLAEFIAEHEEVRTFVREALLDPVVTVLKGTQEIWDSR